LNQPPNQDFEVVVSDTAPQTYELEALIDLATEQNREVLLLQKSLEISRKQEVEIAATRKPQINANGSVGYSYNNTNAGFLLSNQNIFVNAGVAARWNIFDGHNRKNQLAIAEVNSAIIQKQQKELNQQIATDLTFAYNRYVSDQALLTFEESNKAIAEENLSISLEKFRLGGSTILELNETQRTFDTVLNRLVNAQYNVKISELELLRLSGSL
ncbi:MAG: TolC family protein, partial [Bacteroidota bacterium]